METHPTVVPTESRALVTLALSFWCSLEVDPPHVPSYYAWVHLHHGVM